MRRPLVDRMADKPHYVYRHYGHDGQLLYVGCTSQPKVRTWQHRKKSWWPDVALTTIDGPMDHWTAGQMEQRAIDNESPVWNVYGNRILGGISRERYLARLEWSRVHARAKERGLSGSGVVIERMRETDESPDEAIEALCAGLEGARA